MKYTFQYESEEQRGSLIATHSDKTIIEEQNIAEGNFLIFSDNPEEDTKLIVYVNLPEKDFIALKKRQDATENALLDLLLLGGM